MTFEGFWQVEVFLVTLALTLAGIWLGLETIERAKKYRNPDGVLAFCVFIFGFLASTMAVLAAALLIIQTAVWATSIV